MCTYLNRTNQNRDVLFKRKCRIYHTKTFKHFRKRLYALKRVDEYDYCGTITPFKGKRSSVQTHEGREDWPAGYLVMSTSLAPLRTNRGLQDL